LTAQKVFHEFILTVNKLVIPENLIKIVLPTAIPQVQRQIAHKLNLGFSDINGKTDIHCFLCFFSLGFSSLSKNNYQDNWQR